MAGDPQLFVDTEAVAAAANDLANEKPTLETNRSGVSTNPLPAEAFGTLFESPAAANFHDKKLKGIGDHLDKAMKDLDEAVNYMLERKEHYEGTARAAAEKLKGLKGRWAPSRAR